MAIHQMKNWVVFLLLFSSSVFANMLSFSRLPSILSGDFLGYSLEKVQQSMDLYDCGLEEENREFCSDVIKYYQTDVEVRILIEDALVSSIELRAPFSANAYSELQLNLRKDGYSLSEATVEGSNYDVIAALKHKPMKQVNREVVLFLNNGKLSSDKTLLWRPKATYFDPIQNRGVSFQSNHKGIVVRFARSF